MVALESAQWLWTELEEAISLNFILHEVACTDFLLKRLRKDGGTKLIVETITDEISTGADWEWWFMTTSGYALPVRVQAKVMYMQPARRINRADDPKYQKLHYHPAGALLSQTETLIHRSISDGMFPLYCLYTHFNSNFIASKKHSECILYTHHPDSFGVSLIGAETVLITKAKNLSDLFPEVHGFPCIFRMTGSLLHIERSLRSLWPYTSRMIYSGADRENAPIPVDSVREREILIRGPDETPEYVKSLHTRAVERLNLLTSDFIPKEEDLSENDGVPSDNESGPARILPEGTGRATVFLIPDIEPYPAGGLNTFYNNAF